MTAPELTRADWIGLLGRTSPAALQQQMEALDDLPAHTWLRRPETGTVMVRGRAGGTGTPFNLGEVTATRCTLCLGEYEGHALVQGRDAAHAKRAALIDALMQGDRADIIRQTVLTPLAKAEATRRATRHAKAEATRVNFETMVRGEDA